jgi:4-carboxymuconolactone decarboxylase
MATDPTPEAQAILDASTGLRAPNGDPIEIAILRVGWNCRSVYEFGQHTRLGRQFGLTDEDIADIAGGDVDRFSSEDRAFDQMIEMVMVAGFYRLVSGFLNSAGVALEEGTPGWPPGASERL